MTMSERVEREFEKWREMYYIETKDEFQVKTLLKLQEEYDNIEPHGSNTLTRKNILDMIQMLNGISLREKRQLPEVSCRLLIVCDDVAETSNFFRMIIPEENIAKVFSCKEKSRIDTTNGVVITFVDKTYDMKCLKTDEIDEFWNLTNDRGILADFCRE